VDSNAEVAELPYTAVAATTDRITARLVVRRVRDARPTPATRRPLPDALFPVWRYHPFFTNTDLPTAQADIVHRRHAIICECHCGAPGWRTTRIGAGDPT
jgi:hypothetical protein